MNIAVVGANTPLGRKVVINAENEGIRVTSIVSSPTNLAGSGPVLVKECHELSLEELSKFHAIVDAVSFPLINSRAFEELPALSLAPLLRSAPCHYLGFGSAYILYADKKRRQRVMDCDGMFYVKGQGRAYLVKELFERMEHIAGFNYTLLCPPLTVSEEEYASGSFELSDDILPLSLDGSSSITMGDYALAMVELLKRGLLNKKLIAVRNL